MATIKVENGDRERSPIRKDDDRPSKDEKGGRERDRDRDRRGRSGTFGGAGGRRDRGRHSAECRVYVSNIPYEYKWQDLKDLFRKEIGDVTYVELFNDESGKPRGCGIVEFASPDLARDAVEKVHRLELNGRKLVVKEDRDVERDQYGHIIRGRRDDDRRDRGPPGGSDRRSTGGRLGGPGPGPMDLPPQGFNTYGLSPQFLESLGIRGPLTNKVFVANLDFTVNERKLEEVFKLAGRIRDVDLARDKDKKSRGWAVIEFDHPVEAVQAISMFHNQELYNRKMSVRLDEKDANETVKSSKLPDGLKGIGMGLSPAAPPPMTDFGRMGSGPMGMGLGLGGPAPLPAAPLAALGGLQGVLSLLGNLAGGGGAGADLSALTALSGLGGLGGSNLGGSGGIGGGSGHGGGLGLPSGMGGSTASAGGISGLGGIGNSLGGMGGGNNPPSFGSSGMSQSSGPGSYTPSPSSAIRERMYGERREIFGDRSLDRPMDRPMDRGSDLGRPLGGGGGFDSFGAGGSLMSSAPGPVPPPSSGMPSGQGPRGGMARSSDSVKISSLPSHVTWQMLRDKFSEIGEVRFAEVRGRGEGIVRFVSERDAQRAIDVMDRTRYEGRLIDVAFY